MGVEEASESLTHFGNLQGPLGLHSHHVHLRCEGVDSLGLELLIPKNKLFRDYFYKFYGQFFSILLMLFISLILNLEKKNHAKTNL